MDTGEGKLSLQQKRGDSSCPKGSQGSNKSGRAGVIRELVLIYDRMGQRVQEAL